MNFIFIAKQKLRIMKGILELERKQHASPFLVIDSSAFNLINSTARTRSKTRVHNT